jgi:hypothetical protein
VLNDDGVLQVVRKLDRFVVINTFQSNNDFGLDLLQCESASLADDTDYDIWHAALGYLFIAKMNQKLVEDGHLIPDCLCIFTCNLCALSNSKQKLLKPLESKPIEVFELIHTDICGAFSNES